MKEESMKLTSLPVVRKKLGLNEVVGVPAKRIVPGDVITLPSKKGKKFIAIFVAQVGQYVHYVPLAKREQASFEELQGGTVSEGGFSNPKTIEG